MAAETSLNPRLCTRNEFPSWGKPLPVGCFSVNTQRLYEPGHENVRFLRLPNNFPLNLNAGVEKAIRKPENPMDEAIDRLLEYIIDNYKKLKDPALPLNPQFKKLPLLPIEFVCWRGLLRTIMCTPFEHKNGWIIDVIHYKGTFYFCQRETEEVKRNRKRETPLERRMCSWGYKFEQYCLSKAPNEIPKTNEPVDECAEFACVYNTIIENHNLLYGAEMDGIRCDRPVHLENELPLKELEFVELKTSLKHMNPRQTHSFHMFKIRNWWCQAFLVAIDSIVVGWRDESGHVLDIEEMKVSQLPKQAKNWNANHCAQFLVSFLDCVKSLMTKVDCPYTVWQFRYEVQNARVVYEVFEGYTKRSFLADFYIQFIERVANSTV